MKKSIWSVIIISFAYLIALSASGLLISNTYNNRLLTEQNANKLTEISSQLKDTEQEVLRLEERINTFDKLIFQYEELLKEELIKSEEFRNQFNRENLSLEIDELINLYMMGE